MKDIILTQSCVNNVRYRRHKMENLIAVMVVIAFLGGILLVVKKFLKAPKGPLPDCCGPRGNRDI